VASPADTIGHQFVRYAGVGAIAFGVDFGALWALTELAGLHYLVSAVAGFALGLAANYWLSLRWVFRRRTLGSASAEFGVFALVGVIGLGLNELVLWAATERIGLPYLASKCVAAMLVLVWNFLARRQILFR
jgi:putative flippase GtrA